MKYKSLAYICCQDLILRLPVTFTGTHGQRLIVNQGQNKVDSQG